MLHRLLLELMMLKESFRQFVQRLISLYSEREAWHIADMIFEEVTGFSRLDRITKPDYTLTTVQMQRLKEMEMQLLNNMPVQYVLGEAWFYHLKFKVNNNVLIPRPETEELVTWIIEDIKKEKTVSTETSSHPWRILDIGTGSGCIAIALKKNIPEIEMIAIDKSKEALQIAKKNAVLNQVDISFQEADMTDEKLVSLLPDLDIIVSNPPYVPVGEKKDMQPQVSLYEPPQALFVPDEDPLLFYKAIFTRAAKKLVNNGKAYLEIHADYGKEIIALMNQHGFEEITLREDMAGNERMVKGMKR